MPSRTSENPPFSTDDFDDAHSTWASLLADEQEATKGFRVELYDQLRRGTDGDIYQLLTFCWLKHPEAQSALRVLGYNFAPDESE